MLSSGDAASWRKPRWYLETGLSRSVRTAETAQNPVPQRVPCEAFSSQPCRPGTKAEPLSGHHGQQVGPGLLGTQGLFLCRWGSNLGRCWLHFWKAMERDTPCLLRRGAPWPLPASLTWQNSSPSPGFTCGGVLPVTGVSFRSAPYRHSGLPPHPEKQGAGPGCRPHSLPGPCSPLPSPLPSGFTQDDTGAGVSGSLGRPLLSHLYTYSGPHGARGPLSRP